MEKRYTDAGFLQVEVGSPEVDPQESGLVVRVPIKEGPQFRVGKLGITGDETGGSHLALVRGLAGGKVPQVDVARARDTFAALHQTIDRGLVRACHDLSEGGLAVAAAEMAFAGGYGASIDPAKVPVAEAHFASPPAVVLFAESNSRFLCEVETGNAAAFAELMHDVPCAQVGEVQASDRLQIGDWLDADIAQLKNAWQRPLAFDERMTNVP